MRVLDKGLFLLFLLVAGRAFSDDTPVSNVAGGLAGAAQDTVTVVKDFTGGQINNIKNISEILIEFFLKYSFQVLGGVLVIVAGILISRYLTKIIKQFLDSKKIDVTISKFLISGIRIMVIGFSVVIALGKFGVEIAPIIAAVSVLGVGVSFALQAPLSNFAAGATLVFTKPFKVGDIIDVAGVTGEVSDIKLGRTELKTVEGITVVVPNKDIIGEVIKNFSEFKRVDITVGVAYNSSIDKVTDIMKKAALSDKRVRGDIEAGIDSFGDSSINMLLRVRCRQDDYLELKFYLNKRIFDLFNEENINIPFPQRDVRFIRQQN
ncbi:MAG: mechanosensitive ion channel [Candidatus Omnitrophica bacterium]|nr:mechanosensitive ion channel [Candidatus Omnitrophota bacterium]